MLRIIGTFIACNAARLSLVGYLYDPRAPLLMISLVRCVPGRFFVPDLFSTDRKSYAWDCQVIPSFDYCDFASFSDGAAAHAAAICA